MPAQVTAVQTDLKTIAQAAIETATKMGASGVSARVSKVRDVTVNWRDGNIEQLNEATTRGLGLSLYVDGRFASVSTSDLRPEALTIFIADSVAMTRTLAEDPFRELPDPSLYKDRPTTDLKLSDPRYSELSATERRRLASHMEDAARSVKGAEAFLSVSTALNDTRSESYRVTSNGFEGERIDTSFWMYASVSVKDEDGRRPEDSDFAGVRFLSELPSPDSVGLSAASRALSRLGSKKVESKVMTMILDNRAGGRLVGALFGPLGASSLQQRRSFLEGKLGNEIGSSLLTIIDEPLVPKGFGSRHFDGEGISAKRMPVFENGVLKNYYVDTYYGKKLKMAPTTGGASNLTWSLGTKSQAELVEDAKEAILVTGFLGGNSNGTTGDYSLGIQGFMVRGGKVAEPIAEMNISGNQLDLWKRLVAVGNDPYQYSSTQTPTLVFEGVSFAGV